MTQIICSDLEKLGGASAQRLIADTLAKADDGELFIERRQTESFVYDDGRLRSASFDESEGFGLRAVSGETAAYAHSSDLSLEALKRSAATSASILNGGRSAQVDVSPTPSSCKLYGADNPVEAMGFARVATCTSRAKKNRLFDRDSNSIGPLVLPRPCWRRRS